LKYLDLESKVLDMGDHLCLLWSRFIYLFVVFFKKKGMK